MLAIEYCATKGFWVLEGPPSSCGGLNPGDPHAVRNALNRARQMADLKIDGSFIFFIFPLIRPSNHAPPDILYNDLLIGGAGQTKAA